ncbi:nucleotide sugar dehydrogenase [Eubacterium limosum]|nr:nucleotide sugar dehydrogenase [Eubacterium limosum]
MKITVSGTGYVGLVTAVCMAEKGHEVTCIDINKEKIDMLRSGHSPIYENGLEELMQKNKEKLHFTLDSKEAYQNAEVIFIGVGTPEKRDGSANLKYINEVVEQISEIVQQKCVVVVKSTVPIGTNDKIEKKLKSKNTKIDVVSNPEFLAQGTAVHDTLCASRIVIGSENKRAKEIMLKVYEKFDAPFVLTNRRSAEMIKYASNDFLALKISYINEIANLCEEIGANVQDVALGMGYDPRIGSKFLKAGIGYGGSCFPKDTKALHWLSNLHDHELKTVKAAIEVNEQQKLRLIKKARKKYNSFEGLTIAVLGLTFKPGTDDIREAPSLVNIPIFLEDGAKVKAWDPVGVPNFKKIYPTEIEYCNSIEATIKDADMCFILTEWPEIMKYDCNKFKKLMKTPIVLDGRNCIKITDEEIIYESIGKI